jgi:hypothetical protein
MVATALKATTGLPVISLIQTPPPPSTTLYRER